jgi:hypothetical protein
MIKEGIRGTRRTAEQERGNKISCACEENCVVKNGFRREKEENRQ